MHACARKEECAQGKNERERATERREGRGENTQESEKDTKFKGTGSKARNPWAMTVSFQSGNGEGISSAFKISTSVYWYKNEQSNNAPVG